MILTSSTRNISTVAISTIMQGIRNAAGIPSTESYGPRVTPGLTDATALVDDDGGTYAGAAAIAAAADSGAGTVGDPYIFENKRFDNSEGIGQCLYFQDATSDAIYITVRNCWFSGYLNGGVRSNSANTNLHITVTNNHFSYDAVNPPASANNDTSPYVQSLGGAHNFYVIANTANDGGRAFYRALNAFTGTLTITDNKVTDTDNAWTSAASAAFAELGSSGASTSTIKYNEIDSTTNDSINFGSYVAGTATSTQTFTFNNNDVNGSAVGFAILGTATRTHTGEVKYNRFRNHSSYAFNAVTCDGVDIQYNQFDDLATNIQQILLNGTSNYDITNVTVKYNKMASSVGANSECVYCKRTINTEVANNWITQCADDSIEFTEPQTGNSAHDNVCDNVTGQAVDLFTDYAGVGGSGGGVSVYNIYGDADVGVDVNSRTDGDQISGIFVDTTVGTNPIVRLINVSAAPANVSVMGPIWPASKSGAATNVATSGVMGANNHYNGVALT